MNFDDLRGGDKPDIHDVLADLEDKKIISDWNYNGDDPTCEEEFNERFVKIVPNEEGWGERVTDPSKFGITYQEVMSHYDMIMKEFNAIKHVRERKYPKVEEQLDQLWHDIDDGILGEEAKNSKWFQNISKIKNSSHK